MSEETCWWPTCHEETFAVYNSCWYHGTLKESYRYSKKQDQTGWLLKKLKQRRTRTTPAGTKVYYCWAPLERTTQFLNRKKRSFKQFVKSLRSPVTLNVHRQIHYPSRRTEKYPEIVVQNPVTYRKYAGFNLKKSRFKHFDKKPLQDRLIDKVMTE